MRVEHREKLAHQLHKTSGSPHVCKCTLLHLLTNWQVGTAHALQKFVHRPVTYITRWCMQASHPVLFGLCLGRDKSGGLLGCRLFMSALLLGALIKISLRMIRHEPNSVAPKPSWHTHGRAPGQSEVMLLQRQKTPEAHSSNKQHLHYSL